MPKLNNIIRFSSCSFVQPQAEIQEVNKNGAKNPQQQRLEKLDEGFILPLNLHLTPPVKPLLLQCLLRQQPHAFAGESVCIYFLTRGWVICSVNIFRSFSLLYFCSSDTQTLRVERIKQIAWSRTALDLLLWLCPCGTIQCTVRKAKLAQSELAFRTWAM